MGGAAEGDCEDVSAGKEVESENAYLDSRALAYAGEMGVSEDNEADEDEDKDEDGDKADDDAAVDDGAVKRERVITSIG